MEAPVRELRQVLLQGLGAERVGDLKFRERAVGPVRARMIGAVAGEKLAGDAVVSEARVIEVAAHGGRTGDRHRQVMVRPPPELGLRHMARGAQFAPTYSAGACAATSTNVGDSSPAQPATTPAATMVANCLAGAAMDRVVAVHRLPFT